MYLQADHPLGVTLPAGDDIELPPCLRLMNYNVWYGKQQVLFDVDLEIADHAVTAIIGPSRGGKSTLLRCFNHFFDLAREVRVSGEIYFKQEDIRELDDLGRVELRRRLSIICQNSTPFANSVYENIAYGLRLQGIDNRAVLDDAVEKALKSVALWSEVKKHLYADALQLSPGRQQRLLLARAVALEPEVLLLDDLTLQGKALSPLQFEELIWNLKQQFTIVFITHDIHQAAQLSDCTVFVAGGRVIEYGSTRVLFVNPKQKQTEDYVSKRYNRRME